MSHISWSLDAIASALSLSPAAFSPSQPQGSASYTLLTLPPI